MKTNPTQGKGYRTRLHIGIDARFWGLEHAGIGRYVIELVRALTRIPTQHRFTLFLRRPYDIDLALPKNFTTVKANIAHYSVEEQWLLADIFTRANLDLLHVPHFNVPLLYNRPFVVTVHDLLWHEVTGLSVTTQQPLVYLVKYLGYRLVVRHALRKAKAIFVPSAVTKDKLEKDHGVKASHTFVTPEAPSSLFAPQAPDSKLLAKYGLKDPFVIYVGSAYPHKNLKTLALAIARLRGNGQPVTLAIASARSVFLDRLQRELVKDKAIEGVKFLGFVEDAQLAQLYAHALALIQPSLSEGFGLTGLEAMACGLPVIASDLPIFHEVYDKHALYADPKFPSDFAKKIRLIRENAALRDKLKHGGRLWTKRFSWRKLATATLQVYEKV